MDISIVIVNYKCKGFTLNCVKSILEADFKTSKCSLEREIIVVDNDSDDGIGEILNWQFPEVIFIQSGANKGLGVANNLGIGRARGDYVVIMNPDTLVFPDTFLKLWEFMESQPKAGLAGPKQLNPDQSVQDSCFRRHGLMTPFYRRTLLGRTKPGQKDLDRFQMKDFDHQSTCPVDWLLGSFLFIRRTALKQVGGFDERFFLYFEDTDLCRRFQQAGWQVIYYPQAQIIHNHNRDSAQIEWYRFFQSQPARTHFVSWIRFLLKWRY